MTLIAGRSHVTVSTELPARKQTGTRITIIKTYGEVCIDRISVANSSGRYSGDLLTTLSPSSVGDYLANRFRHRPQEDYIVRRRLLFWRFPLTVVLHCCHVEHCSPSMTPSDNELIQALGLGSLTFVTTVSIFVFFYGTSSLLAV